MRLIFTVWADKAMFVKILIFKKRLHLFKAGLAGLLV